MFMVLVDAYSKWLDGIMMSSITSVNTVEKLQLIFATRLPKMIVTDNGSSFTSHEFQAFCKMNGIQHITSISAGESPVVVCGVIL